MLTTQQAADKWGITRRTVEVRALKCDRTRSIGNTLVINQNI
jgi:hypothetical protein